MVAQLQSHAGDIHFF